MDSINLDGQEYVPAARLHQVGADLDRALEEISRLNKRLNSTKSTQEPVQDIVDDILTTGREVIEQLSTLKPILSTWVDKVRKNS